MLIDKKFAKCCLASLISTCFDLAIFYLLIYFLNGEDGGIEVFIATTISRISSDILAFFINKHWSFGSKVHPGKEMIRFGVLIIFLMLCSAALVDLLFRIDFPHFLAKPCVDVGLFFVNYLLQRFWVFKHKE